MASTAQLKRIADLADRLQLVADKRRGLPIEADDWNTLVAVLRALLEIERVQEDTSGTRLDAQYAPADHAHIGAVGIYGEEGPLNVVVIDRNTIGGPTRHAVSVHFLYEHDARWIARLPAGILVHRSAGSERRVRGGSQLRLRDSLRLRPGPRLPRNPGRRHALHQGRVRPVEAGRRGAVRRHDPAGRADLLLRGRRVFRR